MRRSGFLLPRVVLPLVLAVCLAAPGRAWADSVTAQRPPQGTPGDAMTPPYASDRVIVKLAPRAEEEG